MRRRVMDIVLSDEGFNRLRAWLLKRMAEQYRDNVSALFLDCWNSLWAQAAQGKGGPYVYEVHESMTVDGQPAQFTFRPGEVRVRHLPDVSQARVVH